MSYRITKSSRLFLERIGLKPTSRGPRQQLAPGGLSVRVNSAVPDWQRSQPTDRDAGSSVTPEPWPSVS